MPTYEYLCTKCEHEFDVFQSIKDKALTTCPKDLCARKPWGKGKVKKKIGAGAGLIFKGSGFYITDYRSDSYKEAAKQEAPSTPTAVEKSTAPKETGAKAVAGTSTKTLEKKAPKVPSG